MKNITIDELKKDNPNIDYESMNEADLQTYKLLYMDSLSIEKAAKDMVVNYDINEFNKNFLPFFSGSENLTEENNNTLAQMWKQVSGGTGFLEVNIVDKDNIVLFTIPPMYSTTAFKASGDGSIGKMLADYKLDKNRTPAAGGRLVNSMLDFIEARTGPSTNDPWQSFKIYYGIYENASETEGTEGESFELFN